MGHWVTIFKIKNEIYFLDSFGLHPQMYNFDLKLVFKSKVKYAYYYLNLQTQSDESSACGAYIIFFIHTIVLCKYSFSCLKKKKKIRHSNNLLNDHFIVQYIYEHFKDILPYNCQQLFCNSNFIINRNKCMQYVCKNNLARI